MITLDAFITKYNGKYADYDNQYGAQCVDLIRLYLKECLNLDPYAIPPVGYAKEMYLNFNNKNKYFNRIKNDPLAVPQKGDIIVWGWYPFVTGRAGHVGIFTGGDVKKFVAFSQNYGQPSFSRLNNFSYRGVLGWLRKKEG